MNISIKLDKNFTTQYNRMLADYGTEIAKLNGFSDEQLSYTDFIDNFIDTDTVADSSIDGNANVGHKDIVTLEREMSKPHAKLLAFNKIYYEIQKKYGFKAANEWLKMEWVGDLYMHDANSSTFRSYCFSGDTKILTKKGIKRLDSLVGEEIMVLNKNHGWEQATVKCFGIQHLRKLTLERYGVTKEIYCTPEHKWFVKGKNSLTIIETDGLEPGMRIPFNTSGIWSRVDPSPFGVAHGFVIGDGDKVNLRANFCGDKKALIPYFTPANVSGSEHELQTNGIPKAFTKLPSIDETPSYLYGWLSGYFAADGCVDEKGRCTIASTNREYLEFARDVMCILGMPVNEVRMQERVSNLTGELGTVYVLTLTSEYLQDNFFIRPLHKERIKRNDDRKNRNWIVKSIEDTNRNENVYCAVVDGTESFTLDNNILTHNCFAYDLKDLAEKGLFFIDGHNAQPAEHLITFVDFIKEFVSFASNRTSGAVGLPNLIPYMFYFWHKDVEDGYYTKNPEYYAKQNFQRFIYAVNQPYVRDGSQSAFTNTSVFDHPYFEALFGGATFPDGTFMIDYEEDIIQFQKWYMEVMSEIRSTCMFTFPVSTISLLRQNGKFVDEEFAKWAVKHNMKWSDSNLFVDSSVNSLSNCCFDGSQKVVSVKVKDHKVEILTLKELYESGEDTIYTFSRHPVVAERIISRAHVIRLPKKLLRKIITDRGDEIIATIDHMFPTPDRVDKKVIELNVGDYLVAVLEDGASHLVKIVAIEPYENNDEFVYCLQMNDQENPYFILANGILTHNCRLKSNIEDLGYFNSIGGTALKVGSVKVSTINLARLALDTNSEEEYLNELKHRVEVDLQALDCVRHIISRNVEKGLLPNFTHGLIDFEHLYNTIGFIGIYETMKKFGYITIDKLGNTYYTEAASKFGEKIFKTMREAADEFIKKHGCDYKINTEQIPGESAASKLMRKDKFFYPDANIYDLPLYGNQFIPLGIKTTLQERIRIASEFDGYCSGGSIVHLNTDAPFDSFEKAWKMTNYVADQGTTYFAYNTKISACEHNHAFYGDTCPVCGEPLATQYTRIVGFYVPVATYSKDRKAEFKMRRWEPINQTSEAI